MLVLWWRALNLSLNHIFQPTELTSPQAFRDSERPNN